MFIQGGTTGTSDDFVADIHDTITGVAGGLTLGTNTVDIIYANN